MKIPCNFTYKDLNRRQKYKKQEIKYLISKSLFLNQNFSIPIRSYFYCLPHLKTTRIRNRCRLSGKSRTVFKLVGLSRMPFRYFMAQRLLSGFKRKNR